MPLAVLIPAPEKNTEVFDAWRNFATSEGLFISVSSNGILIRSIDQK
jgi:hypothetical protein